MLDTNKEYNEIKELEVTPRVLGKKGTVILKQTDTTKILLSTVSSTNHMFPTG